MSAEYERWSHEQLVARIQDLEAQIKQQNNTSSIDSNAVTSPSPLPPLAPEAQKTPYRKPPKQVPKPFDASRYNTRLIALKFAYLGQKYNGYEHHRNNSTPLPTIEEELWKALVKTRLISPTPIPTKGDGEANGDYGRVGKREYQKWDREGADVNWEGCEYSKCGRTDRGVSAFGQVVGLRVRSNRPKMESRATSPAPTTAEDGEGRTEQALLVAEEIMNEKEPKEEKPFDDLNDELPYIQLLNRILPPDIRVYAWCPNPPPNFSARFSCKERRYKYFFTNPCFAPVPGSASLYTPNTTVPCTSTSLSGEKKMREGWLDIEAMRQGCKELIGLHDFRNFCKIDASKQLTNFQRRIFHADIEEVSPLSLPSFLLHPSLQNSSSMGTAEQPKMYAFVLHGSAFLWHQVRSIIAILFLIGQGLEPPSLISALLDMESNPTRPKYEMASDAPLVLWDCIFPHESEVQSSEEREKGYEDRLEWVYVGDPGGMEPKGKSGGGGIGRGKWGRGGVMDDVWEVWRGNKIDETLSLLLLDTIAAQGKDNLSNLDAQRVESGGGMRDGPRIFDGADVGRAKGRYVPVLQRERQEAVEVVNERYARKKGWAPGQRRARDDEADE